jgi:Uncharacterised nucleotidyltransferase
MLADRALVSQLVGSSVLRQAAGVLVRHGIFVMPLKGVWLQHFVYREPGQRVITDVDVLVSEQRYADACGALVEAGWSPQGGNVSESSYCAPGLPLPLDLHKRLYSRAAFRMSSRELFERSRPDSTTFGVAVVLPDPVDVLAHLIGHALKSRAGLSSDSNVLRDIPQLAAAFVLDPTHCAARLEHYGLARAARFVLPLTAAHDASGFGAAILRALCFDPVGVAVTQAMKALSAHMGSQSQLSALPGFALESSLGRGVLACALRAWDKRFDYQTHHDT